MTVSDTAETPLAAVGLTASDEQLYRLVLRHSGVEVGRLAELLDLTDGELTDRLSPLVAAGLVHVAGRVVVARPPQEVLGQVIAEEDERLQRAVRQLEALRRHLPTLAAEHQADEVPGGRPAEVRAVQGPDLVALVTTLAEASTGDLMWLRPDQWRMPVNAQLDALSARLVATGRRSRAIFPARALEQAPDVLRARYEAGEQIRVLASVPTRLVIMGAHAALIPDRWGVNTGRRLVVQEDSLVGGLTALFEEMWQRAMTVPGLDAGQFPTDARTASRRLLLEQLSRGAKDEQIARTLGLSLRTVRRRVADLLDDLGVDSRFQAGVEAVRRGWI